MANIVRWDDPFAGLTNLHSQLDNMFNDMFNGMPTMPAATTMAPSMDVYTENDKLIAEVQAPGFTKDDVDVSVHNGILEIKGEKHEKEEEKDGKKKRSYMLRESHASFYRRLRLPDYADEDNVDASFENGILKVTVPFKELPKPKRVAISEGKKS
jgi:HSP20 family protein